ncbi:N-acetyltransferase family protein [Nonomuraea diastatica]|uniref:N-acetyltransferase family protein n=1 Tax=Nonomuraea diastatica TaxID=1848329 RepID=A0A4R4VH70_9ACTN|nr:N-acetyltransferase family protein [Nonomuraea diastatica]
MVRTVLLRWPLPAARGSTRRSGGGLCLQSALPGSRAFRETVELSVAIDASCRGLGVGTSLYRALFDSIADEPIHVAVVGIAMPNDASVALHRKFGFTEVGTFHEYAVKDGQYLSSLWMERLL